LTVARSDSPWGPFEANPNNPILTHRNRPDDPFQALGHGDLVETPDGWWLTFLGIRPQGGRYHHLGRETFLAPVTWENGWPVVNAGQPIPATMPVPKLKAHLWPAEPVRDEFNATNLALSWCFVRNPDTQNYSLTARPGWLRLTGSAVTLNEKASPTFIGRRQADLNCRAATLLSFQPQRTNEEAGLVLRGNDNNHCEIGITLRDGERKVFFRKVLAGKVVEPVAYAGAADRDVTLSIQATPLQYEFFCTGSHGVTTSLGTVSTRALATETLTGQPGAAFNFTGVVIGLYGTGTGQSCSVPADFDWFEYRPGQP
jgi:alpha-N-arabinofuranosidase